MCDEALDIANPGEI